MPTADCMPNTIVTSDKMSSLSPADEYFNTHCLGTTEWCVHVPVGAVNAHGRGIGSRPESSPRVFWGRLGHFHHDDYTPKV